MSGSTTTRAARSPRAATALAKLAEMIGRSGSSRALEVSAVHLAAAAALCAALARLDAEGERDRALEGMADALSAIGRDGMMMLRGDADALARLCAPVFAPGGEVRAPRTGRSRRTAK